MAFWQQALDRVRQRFTTQPTNVEIPLSQLKNWLSGLIKELQQQRKTKSTLATYFTNMRKDLALFEDGYHRALSTFLFIERERIVHAASDLFGSYRKITAYNSQSSPRSHNSPQSHNSIHSSNSPYSQTTLDALFLANKEFLAHSQSLLNALRTHPNSEQLIGVGLASHLEKLRTHANLLDQFFVKQGVGMYLSLQRRREELEQTTLLLERTQIQQKNLTAQIQELDQKIDDKKRERAQLHQDPLFEPSLELEKQKQKIDEELDLLEGEILAFFTPLLGLFVDYTQKYVADPLVTQYYMNPITALSQDETLAIIHRCDHIYAILKQSKVDQNTQQVIAQRLDQIENGTLVDIQQRLLQNKMKQETFSMPGLTRDMLMRCKEVDYKIEHFIEQRERLEVQASQLKERCKSIDQSLRSQKKAIEELTQATFQIPLMITI